MQLSADLEVRVDVQMVRSATLTRSGLLPRADYFLAIFSQQHLSPLAGPAGGGSPFWGIEIACC
jgi:hypothetical protein